MFASFKAFVAEVIEPQYVTSAKQGKNLCSVPLMDSTNYRRSVLTDKSTMAVLTGQSWRVLKSWHTGWGGGVGGGGFRRCFADGLNQRLVSSAAQASAFQSN